MHPRADAEGQRLSAAVENDLLDLDWQRTVGTGHDPWGRDGSGRAWAWVTAASSSWTGWCGCASAPTTRPPARSSRPTHCRPSPGPRYAANPYHYAGNDPVNNVDPLGLRPVTDAELAGEHDSGGGLLSSIGHGLLDVAGLVPVVGEAADLANAAWYTAEGDYTMAALSAAAAIPFAGWAATGAKGVIKGGAAVEKLTAKAVVEGAQGAKRALRTSSRARTVPSSRPAGLDSKEDSGMPASPARRPRSHRGRSTRCPAVPTSA